MPYYKVNCLNKGIHIDSNRTEAVVGSSLRPGFVYQNTTKFKVRFLLLLCKTTVNFLEDFLGLRGRLIRADIR